MRLLLACLIWCGLFLVCWPVALLVLIAFPLVWIVSLPFRLVGGAVGSVFAFLQAALCLPARMLGSSRAKEQKP